jgi:hypothetical protein
VLHGNTNDCLPHRRRGGSRYGILADFLAEQVFGRWSIVLHYDLGQGLRAYVRPRREQRLKDMVDAGQSKDRGLERVAEGSGRRRCRARSLRSQQHHGTDGDRLSVA